VHGIPMVIAVDCEGRMLSADAKSEIARAGDKALDAWFQQAAKCKEKGGKSTGKQEEGGGTCLGKKATSSSSEQQQQEMSKIDPCSCSAPGAHARASGPQQ
jgi:hypothetical protein